MVRRLKHFVCETDIPAPGSSRIWSQLQVREPGAANLELAGSSLCRALIDSGAGGSYASAKLISMINKQPCEVKTQQIDMLMVTKTTRIEMYDTEVCSLHESHKIHVKLAKVDKPELLSIKNPGYDKLIREHDHLRGVTMGDRDTEQQLPVHLVLGNREYRETSSWPWRWGAGGRENQIWLGDYESCNRLWSRHDAFDADFTIRFRESVQIGRPWFSRFHGERPKRCV